MRRRSGAFGNSGALRPRVPHYINVRVCVLLAIHGIYIHVLLWMTRARSVLFLDIYILLSSRRIGRRRAF